MKMENTIYETKDRTMIEHELIGKQSRERKEAVTKAYAEHLQKRQDLAKEDGNHAV